MISPVMDAVVVVAVDSSLIDEVTVVAVLPVSPPVVVVI